MLRARLGCTTLCWWCLTVAHKLAPNLEIESMLIHPTKWGIETKNKKNRKIENNGNNGKGTQGKND